MDKEKTNLWLKQNKKDKNWFVTFINEMWRGKTKQQHKIGNK